MEVRSTTGVASGYMPIIGRRAYCNRPSATRPTSKLVPPTSVATTFAWPSRRPRSSDAHTPPTGPEFNVSTGACTIRAASCTPPLDCVTTNLPRKPRAANTSRSLSMYPETSGATYALSNAVMVRSYSPMRGASSCERVTCTPGNSSAASSPMRRSWRGSMIDQSNDTATASTSRSRSRRSARRAWSSSSGSSTLPYASTRSRTPTMLRRGSSSVGFSQCAASVRNCSSMPITLLPRAIGTVASKPAVVMRPMRAPPPVSNALIPTVVACARRSAPWSAVSSVRSMVRAAFSMELQMPTPRSSRVDNALPTPTRPVASMMTQSVNVPPVSTPMRYMGPVMPRYRAAHRRTAPRWWPRR